MSGSTPDLPVRRKLAVLTLLLALLAHGHAPARAGEYPDRPVKIVVPFGPGGSNDVVARAIAVPLAKRLETNVIVDNKAGASGIIGNDVVAKSPRDGSVLLLTSSTFLTVAATPGASRGFQSSLGLRC